MFLLAGSSIDSRVVLLYYLWEDLARERIQVD